MAGIEYLGPFSKKTAFTSKDTHPLLLDLILIKDLGPMYLEWEPETIWSEVKSGFGTSVSEVNKTKIQALRTCHVIDLPYESWGVFEKVTISFNGAIPKFDTMQMPTPHMCALAVEVIKTIRDKTISPEVWKYITGVLLDHGFSYAPKPLQACNPHLLVYVDKPIQDAVKSAIEKKVEPTFDGGRPEDVQIAKAISVSDFVEFHNRKLLKQIEVVLKGSK
jgi:hypothetical protein